ncbi:hypothetical protein NL676_013336 [Syzygium grande]|nr:hypothetical protein NL676_013336 [Syzygium grande]
MIAWPAKQAPARRMMKCFEDRPAARKGEGERGGVYAGEMRGNREAGTHLDVHKNRRFNQDGPEKKTHEMRRFNQYEG